MKPIRHVKYTPVIMPVLIFKLQPLQCSHKCSFYQSETKIFFPPKVHHTLLLLLFLPQDATVEKPDGTKLWQKDQSYERLAKHAPTNMYMMTKWQAIDQLITTLGLIVILHTSWNMFSSINKPICTQSFIYFKLLCIINIFTLCDPLNGQISENISTSLLFKWFVLHACFIFPPTEQKLQLERFL